MPKMDDKERQAKRRANSPDIQITMFISAEAKAALVDIAARDSVTQRTALERLLLAARDLVTDEPMPCVTESQRAKKCQQLLARFNTEIANTGIIVQDDPPVTKSQRNESSIEYVEFVHVEDNACDLVTVEPAQPSPVRVPDVDIRRLTTLGLCQAGLPKGSARKVVELYGDWHTANKAITQYPEWKDTGSTLQRELLRLKNQNRKIDL